MLTQNNAIKVVKEFVRAIEAEGISLNKAILFGSYARNCQHEWSDIDLALVSDGFSGFGYDDKRQIAKINCRKPFSLIQATTFSTLDFEIGDPFVEEIKKTGIVILKQGTVNKPV